jgi:XTP/dITP diphosphohydrolase
VTGLAPGAVIGIASRNEHKIREIRQICADWDVSWVTASQVEADPQAARWPQVEETGVTYLDNALLKGRAVAAAIALPVVADDSGIEVDALGGRPGPRSARFAGDDATDEQNLHALIASIKGVPRGGRTARYRCIAAMCWPDGREVHAEGVVEGLLITDATGEGGFGYDPIFVPEGWDETMAQLTSQEKDRISHRGRAFRELARSVGVVLG